MASSWSGTVVRFGVLCLAALAVGWAHPSAGRSGGGVAAPRFIPAPLHFGPRPWPGSPLDTVSTAGPIVPPAARTPAQLQILTRGLPAGPQRYFVDINGRFDDPLLVELNRAAARKH
jgi:hypothetical protein